MYFLTTAKNSFLTSLLVLFLVSFFFPTTSQGQTCSDFCDPNDPCTLSNGQPGAYYYDYVSNTSGGCSLSSTTCVGNPPCPPAPTATPVPPTSTPTPTPTPACPPGTTDKTITISGISGCGTSGSFCNTGSDCCSGTCDIYKKCTTGPANSYSVKEYRGKSTFCRSYSNINVNPQNNDIPVHFSLTRTGTSCSGTPPNDQEYFRAILNFSGINIPRGSLVRKATLSSPSSGGCQASFLDATPNLATDPSGFTNTGIRFGSGKMTPTCYVCRGTFSSCSLAAQQAGLPLCGSGCGGFYRATFTCGSSGLPSGTADLTSWTRSIASGQDLISASFHIKPEYSTYYCNSEYYTTFAASFQVNSGGTATLTINFCDQSPTPTPTTPPTPTFPPTPTSVPTSPPVPTVILGSVSVCPSGSAFGNLCIPVAGISGVTGAAFTFIFALGIIIALFYLVWGTIRWITSRGDPEMMQAARSQMIAAGIGLITLLFLFLIVNLLLNFFNINLGAIVLPTL